MLARLLPSVFLYNVLGQQSWTASEISDNLGQFWDEFVSGVYCDGNRLSQLPLPRFEPDAQISLFQKRVTHEVVCNRVNSLCHCNGSDSLYWTFCWICRCRRYIFPFSNLFGLLIHNLIDLVIDLRARRIVKTWNECWYAKNYHEKTHHYAAFLRAISTILCRGIFCSHKPFHWRVWNHGEYLDSPQTFLWFVGLFCAHSQIKRAILLHCCAPKIPHKTLWRQIKPKGESLEFKYWTRSIIESKCRK